MSTALSMYTRSLTQEEWNLLCKQFPMGTAGVVHPLLLIFAQQVQNPMAAMAGLQAFVQRFNNCPCWHCLAIKDRPEITLYDLWLRQILYCNGSIQYQLN